MGYVKPWFHSQVTVMQKNMSLSQCHHPKENCASAHSVIQLKFLNIMKSLIYSSLEKCKCAQHSIQQSGTKPKLVAKILANKFGFVPDCSNFGICAVRSPSKSFIYFFRSRNFLYYIYISNYFCFNHLWFYKYILIYFSLHTLKSFQIFNVSTAVDSQGLFLLLNAKCARWESALNVISIEHVECHICSTGIDLGIHQNIIVIIVVS